MSEWKPIVSAPHDGTIIWIVTKLYLVGEGLGIYVPDKNYYKVMMARYDSWNFEFRMLEKGDFINFPKHIVLAWKKAKIAIIPSHEELTKFEEMLK